MSLDTKSLRHPVSAALITLVIGEIKILTLLSRAIQPKNREASVSGSIIA